MTDDKELDILMEQVSAPPAVIRDPRDNPYSLDEIHKRQDAFAYRYLENGFNAAEAYIFCNPSVLSERDPEAYAAMMARQYLKQARIIETISAVTLKRRQDFETHSQMVLNDLQTLKELSFECGDLKTAAKAIELQAKHLGLLSDKHQINQTLTIADLVRQHE